MNHTPASNETKLGILSFDELNAYEFKALKNVWEYLVNKKSEPLTSSLLNKAHKFGFVFLYGWAGRYRVTTPLVGQLQVPPPHIIPELMKNLFDDLRARVEFLDKNNLRHVVEMVAWFEYRFIWIHPYQNTNGRMGRLLSSVVLNRLGYPPLIYVNRSEHRKAYIKAMNNADRGSFSALENFIAAELDQAMRNFQKQHD